MIPNRGLGPALLALLCDPLMVGILGVSSDATALCFLSKSLFLIIPPNTHSLNLTDLACDTNYQPTKMSTQHKSPITAPFRPIFKTLLKNFLCSILQTLHRQIAMYD